MTRMFVYIDGESHFHRSEEEWKQLHGPDASLASVVVGPNRAGKLLYDRPAKLFWTSDLSPGFKRAAYFTTTCGDEPLIHSVRLMLRNFGLDPEVFHEPKKKSVQRANKLSQSGLLEKPKRVDISLAVRVLCEAHNDCFDECHIYTSDADYIPVIKAIRALGKQVKVFGFRNGLAERSDFEFEPDRFIDLSEVFRANFENGLNQ